MRADLTRMPCVFSVVTVVAALGATATPADDPAEEDPAAQDDLVDYALDALRDPAQQKSLVGFSEEQRVMVYYTTSRKKPKAKARAR